MALLFTTAAYLVIPANSYPKALLVTAMIGLMAFLWITEILPLAVTSLIPIVFLPAVGVGNLVQITAYYSRSVICLFLGGFILAIGIEKTGLHKRIALFLLHKIGE